jgi:hypothetical protein
MIMPDYFRNKVLFYSTIVFMVLICAFVLSCSKNGAGDDVDDDDGGGTDDKTAPGTVSDLQVDNITTTTATLSWTAPGDDGFSGWCYQCDFRGSYDSITASNFEEAYKIVDIAGPFLGGTHQIWTLDSLESGTTYYFAFMTRDDMGNWSGLSNCIRAQCIVNQPIVFADSALEAVIRGHLNLPTDSIMISDVDTILELNGDDAGIVDLTGMQFFSKLFMLHLGNNAITDVTPLSGLVNLEGLHLNTNQITDISPLSGLRNLMQISVGDGPLADISPIAGLTKLTRVRFDACNVTDFTPLQSLTELEDIYIPNNSLSNISFIEGLSKLKILILNNTKLTDISPLVGHASLEELYLTLNSITDISALSGLTNLSYINLQYNQISDLAPLVSNSGLGSGDEVRLENNPLSDTSINTHIPALVARGVTVTY